MENRAKSLNILTVLIFISCFISCGSIWAAPYYEGKTLKLIVGHGAGGSTDFMARRYAKYLPKHIPGEPMVIVENMVGSNSITAANHLYSIAKPDGLTIGTFNRRLPFAQLTRVDVVKFDIQKFSWIGSGGVDATILVLRTDLPYESYDDLKRANKSISLAGLERGDHGTEFAILLKEFLGININIIVHRSSVEGKAAILEKKVDAIAGSYRSLQDIVDSGRFRPLIRSRTVEAGIQNLPVNEDLTTNSTGKTIMRMFAAADQIGTPYVAPPGTPAEIVDILKDAFARAAKEIDLKENPERQSVKYIPPKPWRSFEYAPPDQCLGILNYLFSQPPEIVKEFLKYVKF